MAGGRQWWNDAALASRLMPPVQCSRKTEIMTLQQSHRTAFTLVEIIIVVAIIGLLAAIAVPNYIKARTTSQTNACIENLKKLDGAKRTWALEKKKVNSSTPGDGDLFGPTLYIRDKPECPASGTYTLNRMDTKPDCNISGHTI